MRLVFCLMLSPFIAALASAEPEDSAAGDTLAQWMPRAERGEAQAQYLVGNAFFTGHGAPKEYKQAAEWLRKAAIQGHTKAMVQMGLLCSAGKGVPLDSIEALKWYTLAEQRGDPEGKQGASALAQILTPDQVRLGRQRAVDSNVKFLPEKRRRAKAGDARAQFEVGLAYYRGLGVEVNYKEAAHWFGLAAAQGQPEAQNNLGNMYELGQGVKKNYKKAMSLFRQAARTMPQAEVNIGGMYYKGEGVPKDIEKAFSWNESAASKGSAEAYHNLGSMYYNGIGTKKDPIEACKWFLLAASRGDMVAQRNIAKCSEILPPKDWAEAQSRADKLQKGN